MIEDVLIATARLVDRAGGRGFEIGYLNDDPDRPDYYAHAQFAGTRISVEKHKTAEGAALELAEKLIDGGSCRCGRIVALSDENPDACRWKLTGDRWQPGCDAPTIKYAGQRGDLAAMADAYRRQHGKDPR